ncbi:MAG: SDR family oxidoreductase [Desulfopila sp.]|jgi:NAD(P)-dependent dehydrogenase (short-subunit alcohol dehydrogenase family)|nr:SDR family oxidoreductase [Desulfopila sp.]
MVDVRGKAVLVTGGAQGIGRGIVEYLLGAECLVVVADIDHEAGEELAGELSRPDRLLYVPADVGDEQQVKQAVAAAVRFCGRLDGLVNNAAIAHPGNTPLMELSLDDWEKMLRTNLTSAFLMVKHAASHLITQRGAVVNIASTRAIQSEADTEAYAASKGGLVSLSHAMAISLGSHVRVNTILPGWIDVSNLRKKAVARQVRLSQKDHEQHPVGRVGRAADIASLTAFLLSDEAGFITAQQFIVDGGMTRKMIYTDE